MKKVDDPFRFMSTALDWRRVLTGVVVGAPCVLAMYASTVRVLETRAEDMARRMDTQREFFIREIREGDTRVLTTVQREIDAVRADMRELRARREGNP